MPLNVERLRDELVRTAFSTVPINHPLAEGAVASLYHAYGLPPPGEFIWVQGPNELIDTLNKTIPIPEGFVTKYATTKSLKDRLAPKNLVTNKFTLGDLNLAIFGVKKYSANITFVRSRGWEHQDRDVRSVVFDQVSLLQMDLFERTYRQTFLSSRVGGPGADFSIFMPFSVAWKHAIDSTQKYIPEQITKLVNIWYRVAKNVFYFVPFKDVCLMVERPTSVRVETRPSAGAPGMRFIGDLDETPDANSWSDSMYRFHGERKPALEFADGYRLYFIHGIQIPQSVVEHPEKITISAIHRERNAEVRRVLIDLYGRDRFFKDSAAVEVSKDKYGRLLEIRFEEIDGRRMDFMRVVELINSTAEPDGTFKKYYLNVPWTVQTAHEAVAWTFGLTPEEYNPLAES